MARLVFAACVAVASTLLIAPQTTEFGAKVGLLAGRVLLCAARLPFERFFPAARPDRDRLGGSCPALAAGDVAPPPGAPSLGARWAARRRSSWRSRSSRREYRHAGRLSSPRRARLPAIAPRSIRPTLPSVHRRRRGRGAEQRSGGSRRPGARRDPCREPRGRGPGPARCGQDLLSAVDFRSPAERDAAAVDDAISTGETVVSTTRSTPSASPPCPLRGPGRAEPRIRSAWHGGGGRL